MEPARLVGWEIHGFHTVADLNIEQTMEDASKRWLRPNEIYAILSNYTHFKIQPQPVLNPESGRLLLFDRNMLRNFRKDGHNWRKKKDGKTVQEAHEKLKIGTEERIHVYYARSEDDPRFYRRCYWLLDRSLEHIVLVHYRRTLEDLANQQPTTAMEYKNNFPLADILHPSTPLNSTSSSNHVETSGSGVLSEEINSEEDCAINAGHGVSTAYRSAELDNHELTLDMINEFDWGSLLEPEKVSSAPSGGGTLSSYKKIESGRKSMRDNGNLQENMESMNPIRSTIPLGCVAVNQPIEGYIQADVDQNTVSKPLRPMNVNKQEISRIHGSGDRSLQFQNNFGQWDYVVDNVPGPLHDLNLRCQMPGAQELEALAASDQHHGQKEIFSITDISPSWSFTNKETKVIVVGHFLETHNHLANSNIFFVFGDIYVPAEVVQHGVYRSLAPSHAPGLVNFYLTLDGKTPISQAVNFEFCPVENTPMNVVCSGDADIVRSKKKDKDILIRLIRLLFSTSNIITILTNGVSQNALKGVKKFVSITSPALERDWIHLSKLVKHEETSLSSAEENLFELVLKSKVQEWILTKLAGGCITTELDNKGLGVIHLCAIMDYTWAAHLFKASGLSLDFRDVYGWTALHWAAYCGRVRMVATLLSSGANPSLVTDPTTKFPGGCTAADLASQEGYEGLAAYLAENALRAHFEALTVSYNTTVPAISISTDLENIESGSEQEVLLKYSLAAYRNAADAADRIHIALRERSLKLQVKTAQLANAEEEAAGIVAALRIQKAFRNHSRRKMMKAAARIQGTFRTWQARKNFLNMRQHAIQIQAIYRGHLVRRQYRKIIWSVGVLEKAVLRWRLKRKGLRGLHVESVGALFGEQENRGEEDFYRISRQQAEERVDRSVIRVQAMFRSHHAQKEYRAMKLAHDRAKLEYNEFTDQVDM